MVTIETRDGKRVYETVAERVKKFRSSYPVDSGWQLFTEIEFPKDELVLCRAKIIDPEGRVIATGTAEEVRGSSYINKTSAVENAETSAIGRALFAAGFGGGEFCSADELMTALKRQDELLAAQKSAGRGENKAGSVDEQPQRVRSSKGDKISQPLFDDSADERRIVSPEAFGLPEDCGIEFVQEGSILFAKDRKKGATFSNRELLKSAGFSFDGYQRVWFKRTTEEAA